MTNINSNGSKWAGEEPDSIEQLCEVLKSETLDRTFEDVIVTPKLPYDKTVRFWGNFATVSHVFSIDTDDPEVIARLTKLIRENQQTAAYLAQPKPNGVRLTAYQEMLFDRAAGRI